jgi:hypothetical protein
MPDGPFVTLSHAGDAGDLVYGGPLFRAIGRKMGFPIDLVLYPAPYVRVRQTPQTAENVLSFMRLQPYIGQARFAEYPEGNLLDGGQFSGWRSNTVRLDLNIAEMQLAYFGFPPDEANVPWLTTGTPLRSHDVLIHRSPRYWGLRFPWRQVLERYAGRVGFVGLTEEHASFTELFGPVPYVPTRDVRHLAQLIAGCKLFVGNQSMPFAIAEGLKKTAVLECYPPAPNCYFDRPNVTYGVGVNVLLPDVDELSS